MDSELAGGSLLILAVFLSTFIEFIVERLFGSFGNLKGWPMVVIAAVAGVALCVGMNVDILKMVGFEGTYSSWIGQVISGLIVGSGSNALHKFIKPSSS